MSCARSPLEPLDQELLDVELELLDLVLELAALVGGDAGGDHGTGDATGPSQGGLAGDKDVGHVLVLGEEREVEEDLDGLSVGGHDDHLADATVEGLGGLVGALFDLLVVGRLVDEAPQGVGQLQSSLRTGSCVW